MAVQGWVREQCVELFNEVRVSVVQGKKNSEDWLSNHVNVLATTLQGYI